MADRPPLLVVDAPSLLFRAYYALPASIKDGEGRPVNALLGSVNIMLNEIARHGPRAAVMAFGQDAADYRVELFPDYHADRRELEADEAIDRQFEAAPALYEAFGWDCLAAPGYEADDVLGSYAHAEQRAGGRVLILTGDRDMFQCVTDDCAVLYLTTGSKGAVMVDEREVRRRYGCRPRSCPTSSPCGAIPPTASPEHRASGRRRPPTCCSDMDRSRARSPSPPPSARAWPLRCARVAINCVPSRTSRRCAR